jgi:hypothetical protein
VWNIIVSGCLIALEIVFGIAYVWRLHTLPVSERAKDRRVWQYRLVFLLLLTAAMLSNLIYLFLNRPR